MYSRFAVNCNTFFDFLWLQHTSKFHSIISRLDGFLGGMDGNTSTEMGILAKCSLTIPHTVQETGSEFNIYATVRSSDSEICINFEAY